MAKMVQTMISTPQPGFLFSWTGSELLAFFAAAFALALIWSLANRKSALRSLSRPYDSLDTLEDPIEIAFLAGGASRCTQVALVRLIEQNLVAWKKGGMTSKGKLIASGPIPEECSSLERAIFHAIALKGQSGMTVKEPPPVVSQNIVAIESRLASKGLRPTSPASECRSFSRL